MSKATGKQRKIKLSRVCRSCLSERGHLREIFSTRIPLWMEACASVQVSEDDGLPKQICVSCFHHIAKFYNFKKKMERSDRILRTYIKQNRLAVDILRKAVKDAEIEVAISELRDDRPQIPLLKCESDNHSINSGYSSTQCENRSELQEIVEINRNNNSKSDFNDVTLDKTKEYKALFHKTKEYGFDKTDTVEGRSNKKSEGSGQSPKKDLGENKPKERSKLNIPNSSDSEDDLPLSQRIKSTKTPKSKNVKKTRKCKQRATRFITEVCRSTESDGDGWDILQSDTGDSLTDEDAKNSRHRLSDAVERDILRLALPHGLTSHPFKSEILKRGAVTGGPFTNNSVSSGSIISGLVTGGSVIGGLVTQGSVVSGLVTSASVTSGSITGGSVTGGSVTGGSITGVSVAEGPPPLIPLAPTKKADPAPNPQPNLPENTPPLVPIKPLEVVEDLELELECKACDESFSSVLALKEHRLSNCPATGLQCNICRKDFKDSKKLIGHLKGHMVSKDYACKLCGKRYPNPSTFQVHMRTHTGERPFKCQVCGKGFVRWAGVVGHMKTHTSTTPYKCETCGKGFKISSNLERHKVLHSGVMPFCCSFCGKTFSQNDNLQLHIRTHHTNDRPYLCNVCGKGFVSSTRLNRHMWVHTGFKPYMCRHCPKAYTNSNDLKRHEWTHQGKAGNEDKPHPCPVCPMRFFHPCRLAKHMQTHDKNYYCSVCNRAFGSQMLRDRHEATHIEDVEKMDVGDDCFKIESQEVVKREVIISAVD